MNGQAFPQEANGLGNLVTNCKLKLALIAIHRTTTTVCNFHTTIALISR